MQDNVRILAKGQLRSNDTWATGLNNNDLIVGPSGAGKTRSYVKPNIMQCNESMIIADTKGSLISEVGPVLERSGYKVIHMNFKDLGEACGYNPLDYIRYDKSRRAYSEQDVMTVANALIPTARQEDPYWENAARMYATCMIAYALEFLPRREHSLQYVMELFAQMGNGNLRKLFQEAEAARPNSLVAQTYRLFAANCVSEKTEASILAVLGEKFNGLQFDAALRMYHRKKRINFMALGREKTAVFLTISDMDRSMDRLISLFYTQALQTLCDSADTDYPDHRLPVPVRFILDDFATNAYIPDFQNIISVIRSREIYVSIILQSITQLAALYGQENAKTIINNCDTCLYLGGGDTDTARFMSVKANKTVDTILNMPLDAAYLFTRGSKPRMVEKFDIREHRRYAQLPEAQARCPAPSTGVTAPDPEPEKKGGRTCEL